MPLRNHLKEYRAKINVNQQEMGSWWESPDRPSARLKGGIIPRP